MLAKCGENEERKILYSKRRGEARDSVIGSVGGDKND
jgi:hypothetical protein